MTQPLETVDRMRWCGTASFSSSAVRTAWASSVSVGVPILGSFTTMVLATSRTLGTRCAIPYGTRTFDVSFDLIEHNLLIQTSDGASKALGLFPRSVAAFYHEVMAALRSLNIDVTINPLPQEVPNPIRFDQDDEHASYDPEYAHRFWRGLVQADRVF
jgi:hypothetical protein